MYIYIYVEKIHFFQNGFWFSIGWCVAFLIPMLISGAILTNYIRRSPPEVHPITDSDDISYV